MCYFLNQTVSMWMGHLLLLNHNVIKYTLWNLRNISFFFKEERTQFLVVEVSMGLIYKRMLAGT